MLSYCAKDIAKILPSADIYIEIGSKDGALFSHYYGKAKKYYLFDNRQYYYNYLINITAIHELYKK